MKKKPTFVECLLGLSEGDVSDETLARLSRGGSEDMRDVVPYVKQSDATRMIRDPSMKTQIERKAALKRKEENPAKEAKLRALRMRYEKMRQAIIDQYSSTDTTTGA